MANTFKLTRYSFRTRALLISIVVLAYTISFFLIYTHLRNGIASSLSILPAITIGWLCGKNIGFFGAIVLSAWSTLLFIWLGEASLARTFTGSSILGSLILVIAGIGVGWLSEMLQKSQLQAWHLAQEIEERKRVEENLRASEMYNQAVLSAFPDMIFTVSATGEVLSYHVHDEEELLVPASKLIGSQIEDIVPSDLAQYLHVHIENAIRTGAVQTLEFQFPAPGEPQHFEARLTRIDERTVMFIVRNTTDRVHAQQQQTLLAAQEQHIKVLNQLITNFSHDFKTPLSIINTNAYLLQREPLSTRVHHRVQDILEQSKRIENDVRAILTLAKLDGTTHLPLSTLNLNQVVVPLQIKFTDLASANDVTLNFDIEKPIISISGHERTLAQALDRLIENAIRYNKQGGTVTIRSFTEGDEAVVEIADTGIGIDPADHDQIYERFFRADPARNVDTGGVGVGLSIARKCVELHEGRIELESQLDRGSTFRLYLKLAGQPQPAKPDSDNDLSSDSPTEI